MASGVSDASRLPLQAVPNCRCQDARCLFSDQPLSEVLADVGRFYTSVKRHQAHTVPQCLIVGGRIRLVVGSNPGRELRIELEAVLIEVSASQSASLPVKSFKSATASCVPSSTSLVVMNQRAFQVGNVWAGSTTTFSKAGCLQDVR